MRARVGFSKVVSIAVIVVIVAAATTGVALILPRISFTQNAAATNSVSTVGTSIAATSSSFSASPGASSTSSATGFVPTYSSTNSFATTSVAASSYQGTVGFSPSCFALYSGAVHVFGTISPAFAAGSSFSSSQSIKSVELFWSYHNNQNKWYLLNDLTFGPSFASDGNFSHIWNPPSVAYYDFEANWTLAGGQIVTAITPQPFQVVAQGAMCP